MISGLIIAFSAGALALQFLSKLPSVVALGAALFCSGLATAISWYFTPNKKPLRTACAIFCSFVIGLGWATIYAHHILSWTLPKDLEGKNIVITGYVASLPKIDTHHISFNFDLRELTGKPSKTRIVLSWYENYPSYPQFKVGDKWQFTVRLKRPHSTLNPGEFDYEAYLLANHIRATGYVVNADTNQVINSHWQNYAIHRVRQYLEYKVQNALVDQPLIGLITALIVGDESKITQDEWQVLRRTGTIHFVVIAGLHIGFVASFMFFLGKFLWRLIPRLALIFPATQAGAISALLGAIVYSCLAGLSIPTQRTTIMIAVLMISTLLRRNLSIWYTFLLGLFIVILINPLAGLTSGFWLSFGAVFLIIYALSARVRSQGKIARYSRLQLALTLGLMPLTLLLFQQAPLISFFGNALAVPWIGFIVIPLSLTGAIAVLINEHVGHFLLWLAIKAIGVIWSYLAWLASLPIASWQHYLSNSIVLTSAIIGILLLLAPRGWPKRCIGIIWLIPLLFYTPASPKYGKVLFTLLDVGQGLASVVRTQNHVLVYDTGPRFYDSSDAGERIVIPFLQSSSVKQLDMLVVSHKDDDHSGGARSILAAIPTKNIKTSVPDFFAPYPAEHCYAGQTWQWDGVTFAFLHPPADSKFVDNDASCVLRVSAGANSILLNGDIEKLAESDLVAKNRSELSSKILVAPHHGSSSSSSQPFVGAVNPTYVLFATGYDNRFHFPNKSVVTRYLKSGAILLNTADTGAITFRFDGQTTILTPELYRIEHPRYWFSDMN